MKKLRGSPFLTKLRVLLFALSMTCFYATATDPLAETHSSLAVTPEGAAEVLTGTFFSALLGEDVPYRVFSPLQPDGSGTMPIAIYTMNVDCPKPRPSSATDRAIIEDFINRQFLVAAVDFSGGKVTDHLEWSKDIHGLIHVFGGELNADSYTENRNELICIPGPHAGTEITSVPSPDPSGNPLSIDMRHTYVVPPGYTVEISHVFNPDSGWVNRPELYFDIIYPMPSAENRKLPILLDQTSSSAGNYVINAANNVLYSWLFNGYAFASTKNVTPKVENADMYPIVQAIRYLRWKADDFSLNKIVSTAAISKAARRMLRESNFDGRPSIVDDMPYGGESSKVTITMPATGAGGTLDDTVFSGSPDYPIWEHLNENSPAVVLGHHHLNPKDIINYYGKKEKLVRDAYLSEGWKVKLFYREVPLAAHEYNIYDLNDIMAFWDKWCSTTNPEYDTDRDGLPDSWENLYFESTNSTSGSADSDGDGSSDFFEYLYGSIPTNAADSGFHFGVKHDRSGSCLDVEWGLQEEFIMGSDYRMVVSTNLTVWDALPPDHYSLNDVVTNGTIQSGLTLTEDYGPSAFLTLDKMLNHPPVFLGPVTGATAIIGSVYSDSISGEVADPDFDPLSFAKESGPEWLNVSSNGILSGTPGSSDIGANLFTVQVDALGGSDTTNMTIMVQGELIVDFTSGTSGSSHSGSMTCTVTNGSISGWSVGDGNLTAPAGSGGETGVSGTFTLDFEALGTAADPFDETDFTGGTNAVVTGNGHWKLLSDINGGVGPSFSPGLGLVFTVSDISLTGADTIELSAFTTQQGGFWIYKQDVSESTTSSEQIWSSANVWLVDPSERDLQQGDRFAIISTSDSSNRALNTLGFSPAP